MKAARATAAGISSQLQLFIRIKHPSLAPTEISRVLDIEPEEAIAAGPEQSDTGIRRLHSETYWIAQLPTVSIADLAKRFREGFFDASTPIRNKEQFAETVGASTHDVVILTCLRRFDANQDFFDRILREGGSITLIVGRDDQPVVLKQTLKKLAAFGMTLEVD